MGIRDRGLGIIRLFPVMGSHNLDLKLRVFYYQILRKSWLLLVSVVLVDKVAMNTPAGGCDRVYNF